MQSLINMNKYTSKMIEKITGEKPPTKPIICVGNSVARKHLEYAILRGSCVAVVGPQSCGKMTAVLEICDRHDIPVKISYTGDDFGDAPLRKSRLYYIIRYSTSKPPFDLYVKNDCRVIFIHTAPLKFVKKTINFHALTKADIKKYKQLKGIPLYLNRPPSTNTNPLIKETAELLLGRSTPDKFNTSMDKIIAYNIEDENILKICALSAKTEDPLFKWGLLNMIRVRRPPDLKYPPKLKHE